MAAAAVEAAAVAVAEPVVANGTTVKGRKYRLCPCASVTGGASPCPVAD